MSEVPKVVSHEKHQQDMIKFFSLVQNLKHVNIDKLDNYEREKLKALYEQYKYHLQ